MTTIYEIVEKTYKEKKFVSCTCDWCGNDIPGDYGFGSYNTRHFELKFTTGTSYPGPSGNNDGWEVQDLCDGCVDKLYRLLSEVGIKITEVDEDW